VGIGDTLLRRIIHTYRTRIPCVLHADRMPIMYTNSYAGKIWVSEIISMGAAEKNGQIRVGDILLDVDDVRHLIHYTAI
jgi:C-terminal processing protease CtpA/Prc